jgi:tRNA (cmo5U34)-methyltransferase
MEHIRKAFDAIATEYDSRREFVIPEFEMFYTTAAWAAESSVPEPVILDIGAGTGLLSSLILQKFPDAHMTLLDISENMLEIARGRFAAGKNITYIVSDYSQGIPPGPYDLVCSALSIHHLATDDKRCLFGKIFSALKTGGLFVNADQADGATPYFRKRYLEYWNEFLNRGPMNDRERTEILVRRDNLDRNEKLSDQLQWLKECGFSDVDVVYRNRTFIVTVARKGTQNLSRVH